MKNYLFLSENPLNKIIRCKDTDLRVFSLCHIQVAKKAEVKVSCQADFAKARAAALSAAETVLWFLQLGDCLAVQRPL